MYENKFMLFSVRHWPQTRKESCIKTLIKKLYFNMRRINYVLTLCVLKCCRINA